jgi:hypothetical protein
VLDSFFGNVCELDLVFNFYKVRASAFVWQEERTGMGEWGGKWAFGDEGRGAKDGTWRDGRDREIRRRPQ